MKINRSDFDRFHENDCLISTRTVFLSNDRVNDSDSGVDSSTAQRVIKNLLFLDNINKKIITLYIDNPGGDWYHGMAIYDTIKKLKSPVKAIGTGQVMSMATVIIQACKYRFLTPNTTFMIHDGSDGMDGTCKDFEAWGDYSKYIRKQMYHIYYERMKKKNRRITLEQIENLCIHDKILTAKEAVKLGLVDKII